MINLNLITRNVLRSYTLHRDVQKNLLTVSGSQKPSFKLRRRRSRTSNMKKTMLPVPLQRTKKMRISWKMKTNQGCFGRRCKKK